MLTDQQIAEIRARAIAPDRQLHEPYATVEDDVNALLADRDAMIQAVRTFLATGKPADPLSTVIAFKTADTYRLAVSCFAESSLPEFPAAVVANSATGNDHAH